MVGDVDQTGDEFNHAGVIIRHGDGGLTYAYVAFAEEEISGIELLERSGVERLTIPFGGLGQGVCQLEGEGCAVEECRRRVCQGARDDDPYWRYFRQEAPGQWRALTLGASATKVRDGDVDGWSWTGGDAGLPAATLADVARLAGAGPAAGAADGAVPEPVVRSYGGAGSPGGDAGSGAFEIAAAGGLLVLVGGAALVGVRRVRRGAARAA